MVICIYRQRQFNVFNNAQNATCFGLHDHYQTYTHITLRIKRNALKVLEFAGIGKFYNNRKQRTIWYFILRIFLLTKP